MKNHLAPKYQKLFGDVFLLWFSKSNSYTLLDPSIYNIIGYYLESSNKQEFSKVLENNGYKPQEIKKLYFEISEFLTIQNKIQKKITIATPKKLVREVNLYETYRIGTKFLKIAYSSPQIKAIVHPSWSHLLHKDTLDVEEKILIYEENKSLFLVHNNALIFSCEQKDYHLLQGKISLLVMNTLYGLDEEDYIGAFHASTVAKGDNSIMIIGESGRGKSTLTALLMAHNFELVADDISYMAKKDNSILSYPATISIKEGSLNTLKDYYPFLKSNSPYSNHTVKGKLRYLPNKKDFIPKSYNCNTIVLVNYSDKSDTAMKEIALKDILEILIPESWLSPIATNAKQFLNWLDTVRCYKLNYSNSEEAITVFSRLNLE